MKTIVVLIVALWTFVTLGILCTGCYEGTDEWVVRYEVTAMEPELEGTDVTFRYLKDNGLEGEPWVEETRQLPFTVEVSYDEGYFYYGIEFVDWKYPRGIQCHAWVDGDDSNHENHATWVPYSPSVANRLTLYYDATGENTATVTVGVE